MKSSSSFLCSSSSSTTTLPFGRPLSSGCSSRSSLDSTPKRVLITRILASRREANDQNYYGSGRLVDENMIVLRKRIHEMKVVEKNFEPPSHWMDWEKQYFGTYDSLVCDMVGFLQSQLMDTRPALALGIIGLVTLSVPMSTAMVLLYLMELTKMIVSGISP